jgi:hypothetical protein
MKQAGGLKQVGGYKLLKTYSNKNVTRSDLMTYWKFTVSNQFQIRPRER